MSDVIRPVQMCDLDACFEIESMGFPKAEAATYDSIRGRIMTYPESFLVLERDGRILGYIMGAVIDRLYIEDEMFADLSLHDASAPYQAIFSVCVHPDFQRQGIAAQLIERLIEVSKSRGKHALTLTCKREKLHYYAKFGFEDRGVAGSTHGGALWYNMVRML